MNADSLHGAVSRVGAASFARLGAPFDVSARFRMIATVPPETQARKPAALLRAPASSGADGATLRVSPGAQNQPYGLLQGLISMRHELHL